MRVLFWFLIVVLVIITGVAALAVAPLSITLNAPANNSVNVSKFNIVLNATPVGSDVLNVRFYLGNFSFFDDNVMSWSISGSGSVYDQCSVGGSSSFWRDADWGSACGDNNALTKNRNGYNFVMEKNFSLNDTQGVFGLNASAYFVYCNYGGSGGNTVVFRANASLSCYNYSGASWFTIWNVTNSACASAADDYSGSIPVFNVVPVNCVQTGVVRVRLSESESVVNTGSPPSVAIGNPYIYDFTLNVQQPSAGSVFLVNLTGVANNTVQSVSYNESGAASKLTSWFASVYNVNATLFSGLFNFSSLADVAPVMNTVRVVNSSKGNVVDDANVNYDGSGGSTSTGTGVKITANGNYFLVNVTKDSGCNANTAELRASDKTTVLATASFVGDVATFGGSPSLVSGSSYYVSVSSNGSAYLFMVNSTPSYPIVRSEVNFVGGLGIFYTDDVSIYNVKSVGLNSGSFMLGYCNASDGDSLFYDWFWYKNYSVFSQGTTGYFGVPNVERNVANVSGQDFVNNSWIFGCNASDGILSSGALNSSRFGDLAPSMVGSRVSPSVLATRFNNLSGFCNASDVDGDNVSFFGSFFLNGVLNKSASSSSGVGGVEVNVLNITSGLLPWQSWFLSCLASDGVRNGSLLNSSVTLINNSFPVLLTVTIFPLGASPSDNLSVNYTFSDLEGDFVTNVSYVWFVNNVSNASFNDVALINSSFLRGNDSWMARIAVFDGFNWSVAMNSSRIVIGDSVPPVVNSVGVSSLSVTTADSVIFTANVTDVSSDVLASACIFELYKSDLAVPLFNVSSNSKSTDLISRSLSMGAIGVGVLEWKHAFCSDSSGNLAIYNVSLNVSISAPVSPGGGGGGGGQSVIVKGGENESLFKIETDTGAVESVLFFDKGQQRSQKVFVTSLTAKDQDLVVSCGGSFCGNVKFSVEKFSLVGFKKKQVDVQISVPKSAVYGDSFGFDVFVSDGSGHSGVVKYTVEVNRLGGILAKFAFVVKEGDAGYLTTFGGYAFPKILLYIFVLMFFEVVVYLSMAPSRKKKPSSLRGLVMVVGGLAVFVGVVLWI